MFYSIKNNILTISLTLILLLVLYGNFFCNIEQNILYNNGDPILNLYFLKWGADYILNNISANSIFNLPLAYPFDNSLAFSDNLLGNQVLFLPLYVFFKNPILAYNLWIAIVTLLNYYCMYIYLKKSKFINLQDKLYLPNIGAIIFTYSLPSIYLMGGHIQLHSLFFIPTTLILLEYALYTLNKKYFIFFGLSISFQFYLGIQTGFILLILLLFLMPIYIYYIIIDYKTFFKYIIFSVISFIIPTIYLMLPYLKLTKLTGYRTYDEVVFYAPHVKDFFLSGLSEQAIFVGMPTFILFLLSLIHIKNKIIRIFLLIIVLSYVFILSETQVFKFFFDYIPGFSSIRTPGRFIFVTITLMSIYIPISLKYFSRQTVIFIFLFFILIYAYLLYEKKIPFNSYHYYTNNISSKKNENIRHFIQGKPTIILPLYTLSSYNDTTNIINKMVFADNKFPILSIYSGFNPSFVNEIEHQYVHKIKTKKEIKKFVRRIRMLGFKNILIDKEKFKKNMLLEYFNNNKIFKKKYEDNKVVLFYISDNKKIFEPSLNKSIKSNKWNFNTTNIAIKNNKTFFYGYLKSHNLTGVVQQYENIKTYINVRDKKVECKLQLNKIKDSYSMFECINNDKLNMLFTNKPLNSFGYNMQVVSFPYVKDTNTIYHAKIKINNISRNTWNSYGKYPISVSYKIYDNKNKELGLYGEHSDGDIAIRNTFQYGIKSNTSHFIDMYFKTPYKPGTYTLEIDLVQDGVTWFKERNDNSIKKTIIIN